MRTVVPTSTDSIARVSDHGARVAAGRIGCTVDEYRAHEAAGEHWCPRCASWIPAGQPFVRTNSRSVRAGYCAPCHQVYRSGLVIDARISLTPEGAEAASSIVPTPIVSAQHLVSRPASALSGDHDNCSPSIRPICEGRLPEGWVREVVR